MLYNVFIWFLDQANIGLDPQIMILHKVISEILEISDFEAAILNKNGVKRLNTLGHLDQYMAQHGRIVKQSYCETV